MSNNERASCAQPLEVSREAGADERTKVSRESARAASGDFSCALSDYGGVIRGRMTRVLDNFNRDVPGTISETLSKIPADGAPVGELPLNYTAILSRCRAETIS